MDRTMAGRTAAHVPTPRTKGTDSETAVGLSMKFTTLIKLIVFCFWLLMEFTGCQMNGYNYDELND